jgi:hypothetical protein
VIAGIANKVPGTVHFALLAASENTRERLKELDSWNIRPLFFPEGHFDKIDDFLACLADAQPSIRAGPPMGISDFAEMREGPRSKLPADSARSVHSSRMAVGLLTPYLVNRIQQERELRDALVHHSQVSPRRPLLLIGLGTEEQAIHAYIERVERDSLPKALKQVGYCDHLTWVNLPWTRDDWQNDAAGTIRYLQEDIEARLELRPRSWPEGLVVAVNSRRSVVTFCYRLQWQGWNETHLSTLRAWAQRWACLPALPPGQPIVVFFMIRYQPERRWFLSRLAARSTTSTIHERLRQLRGLESTNLVICVLSELGNVLFDDIEHWILTEVRPPDPVRMIREMRRSLDDPDLLVGSGIPMGRLVDRLSDLLEQTAEEQYAL